MVLKKRTWVPLLPEVTGLRTRVWIGLGETINEDPFVLCSRKPGDKNPDDAAVVAVWPVVEFKPGLLDDINATGVTAWVGLNQQAIRDYWVGRIDPIGMMRALRKVRMEAG